MSLSWDEKVTELIERLCKGSIALSILYADNLFTIKGQSLTGDEKESQSDDLLIALMLLAGMNPSPEDRYDYNDED